MVSLNICYLSLDSVPCVLPVILKSNGVVQYRTLRKKIQNLTEGDYLHSFELIETGSADLSNIIVHTAVIF